MTPLNRPEYIRNNIRDVPYEIVREYNLKEKTAADGSVYIAANRGMYGLPHCGLLANKLLETRLSKRGYQQSKLVTGLWKHKWRPVHFTFVVDYFGVKYVGEKHALEENYTVTTEWDGIRYIGIKLDWDYTRRQVHLSMPGYVGKALKQFSHTLQKKQDQPYPSAPIKYGEKKQYATQQLTAPLLDKNGKKYIKKYVENSYSLGEQ